ncbi:hypothetical protein HUK80_17720 [Flavobacterium sp. MAH-1]|uniref:Nuclear transport factor 2 family protein n=1 Tax=Flavobacterium agri TaxID=2743471 RepID=A0A7Y9C7V3_9FLAO|nr:hypothetical protein [Flavobacterium agri]NUY82746.1 hypothetical protein [Flavobacterium agri]NYA72769.1 hypothetical protein [Flavobacterium agri]
MKISYPDDCDNAPKRRAVKNFIISLYQNKFKEFDSLLDDKFELEKVGEDKIIGKLTLDKYSSTFSEITELSIKEILSHGKFGACQGYIRDKTQRIDFAYFFEFKSAGKNVILKVSEYKIKTK